MIPLPQQVNIVHKEGTSSLKENSPPYFSKKESQPLYTPHNHPVNTTLYILILVVQSTTLEF
jgi:hypothetical protein